MKKALITGITGQVGSYLAEYLLDLGYCVVGLHRRTSLPNFERIDSILDNPNLILEEFDITDSVSVYNVVSKHHPDEIYNLAAQSHVHTSFEQPDYTFRVNALGVQYFLDAIKNFAPSTKFLTCSTSEMFGSNYDTIQGVKAQNENTAFMPQSPYSIAKLAAHHSIRLYRNSYDLNLSTAIMFNNESPRRGENFVTRKITRWIGVFNKWLGDNRLLIDDIVEIDKDNIGSKTKPNLTYPKLRLGNLDAYRDWGYSKDYAEGLHLINSSERNDDYVIATGESHTIREFLGFAFLEVGVLGWESMVTIDPKFYRPSEVDFLMGDSRKLRQTFGWKPKTSVKALAKLMVEHDLKYYG